MFHPNVYNTGELCLDILQNRWSPTYDVAAILTSIQRFLHPHPIPLNTSSYNYTNALTYRYSLLNDPNNSSPANAEAANLHKDNVKEYIRRVKYVLPHKNLKIVFISPGNFY